MNSLFIYSNYVLRYINIYYSHKNIGIIYIINPSPILVLNNKYSHLQKILEEQLDSFKNKVENNINSLNDIKNKLDDSKLNYEEKQITYELIEEDDGEFEKAIFEFKLRNLHPGIGFNAFNSFLARMDSSNYFSFLLGALNTLIYLLENKKIDDSNGFKLAQAIFLAEFINNQLDFYLNSCIDSDVVGIRQWIKSDTFKQRLRGLKDERDLLYDRLDKLQKDIGREKLDIILSQYTSSISRYAFPQK